MSRTSKSVKCTALLAAIPYLLFCNSVMASCNSVQSDLSQKAIELRLAPMEKLTIGEAVVAQVAPGSLGPDAGKKRYDTNCQMCHATGLAGAPKFGDKAAWAPRIKKGVPTLLNTVIKGLNAMPPRGACPTCSDEELKMTIQYMIDQAK